MPVPNLPPDVVRVLSFHGAVDVFVGGGLARGRCHVAPFEEQSYLLIPVGSPLEKALLASVDTEVHARHVEGDYALRMTGHAQPGRTVARHAQRASIEPWMAESAQPGRLLAAPFLAHHIEFVRIEGDGKARYHGPTDVGKNLPSRLSRFFSAAFSGIAGGAVVPAVVAPWIWVTVQGPDYPSRPSVLALQIIGSLALLASVRLAVVALAFSQWRTGQAAASDAPVLRDGLMSFRDALRLSGVCLMVSLVALGTLSSAWEPVAMWYGLLPNLTWLLGPAWLLHLVAGKPASSN